MTAHKAYDKPSNVTPVDGEVAVDGPDGVGLSMTPAAAAETGQRLSNAAAEAKDQPSRPENSDEDAD